MASLSEDESGRITMAYTPEFVSSGYNPSPLFVTPEKDKIYEFSQLPFGTYKGLPGFIADCLPDKFGTAIINHWLEKTGRPKDSYTTIERLLYQGSRAMGALRFEPQKRKDLNKQVAVDLDGLVAATAQVLEERMQLDTNLKTDEEALLTILRVGTSAGGARPKAVVAYNKTTGDLRSGQVDAPEGYEHWLLKLDGVDENNPGTYSETKNYGCLEYAYYKMVLDCGIDMMECRLLDDGNRHHFMTKRFDRMDGRKLHMQSLGALTHISYQEPGACGYELAALYMKEIGISYKEIEQFYRRMVFNCLAVNQDDHVKNISFIMDRSGKWTLSPAYDITFSYNPTNKWLRAHQMTVNGKNRAITDKDILDAGSAMDISSARCKRILDEVSETVSKWPEYAQSAGVPEETMESIKGLQVRADSYS